MLSNGVDRRIMTHFFKSMTLAFLASVILAPVAIAQAPVTATPAQPIVEQPAPAAPLQAVDAATPAPNEAQAAPAAAAAAKPAGLDPALYTPMKPTEGVGMPVNGGIDFQPQVSPTGNDAKWINNAILLPIIFFISFLVLGLLLWVVVRYRRGANPVPSKTTHNTFIEIIWTVVPVLILLVIAVPSISLLAKQYEPAPEGALTVKVTGYQWYWGYSYPDNGGFEVISNMLSEEEAAARGEPHQLAADNRMVIPVGKPVKLLVTGADVIHSFALPSAWFKLDAVPGRINEKVLQIDKVGVYYGQCSELCGVRHGFMPITVEVLPEDKFNNWVRANGGTVKGDEAATEVSAATPAVSESVSAAPAAGVQPKVDGAAVEPVPAKVTQ